MDKDMKWYLKELLSEECLCGKPKGKKKSFCYRCFKSLPAHMQKDLYCMIGYGYEQAFESACSHLQQTIW
jgi:hypothetical protein